MSSNALHNILADPPSYIARDADEYAKEQRERRPGRPASTREDALKKKLQVENQEYNSGYWIPDVTDAMVVHKLKEWEGLWPQLNTLKYIRITRTGVKQLSSYPPKGLS
jgi:translation machinery-associated protein 16